MPKIVVRPQFKLYNLQLDDVTGADFENSLYAFGQSEKRR